MGGVKSHVGTTTFTVAKMKMTKEEHFRMIRTSLEEGGWLKYGIFTHEVIRQESEELLRLAKAFLPGEILEKRGSKIQVREVKKKR